MRDRPADPLSLKPSLLDIQRGATLMKSLESDLPAEHPRSGIAAEYLLDESAPSEARIDAGPVKLERRGVTSQKSQFALWAGQTIHKNSVAAKLREFGRAEDASKLEQCHSRYTMAVCSGCNAVSKFPNRCDQFFCPECQPRLSADRKKAVEWWTREINQPKHIVLTVKNIEDLSKPHIQEFRKWFSSLRRSTFAANWRGGFYSLEVTKEGNGWHLHLHALVDAKWIDAIRLSDQWRKSTKGFGYIVKVKDARNRNYLAEVTKYAVKGVQLAAWSGPDIAKFIDAFRGVRAFGVFGSLYGARTKFSEWWKQVRGAKPACACGCCTARYFSESEFLEMDLVPLNTSMSSLPPPIIEHPEFPFITWTHDLDAIKR
jgi:hypothetical protein